jgi:hypothetical protein
MPDLIERLIETSTHIPNVNIRDQVLQLAGFALFGGQPGCIADPLLAKHLLHAMCTREMLNLDLLEHFAKATLDDPGVLHTLSDLASSCGLYLASNLSPDSYIQRFNDNRSQRGLLHIITTILFGHRVHRTFINALGVLTPEGFAPQVTDSRAVRAAVAILRVARGITTTLQEDLRVIIRDATPLIFEQAQELLSSDELSLSMRISGCVDLIQALRLGADRREQDLYHPLRKALDTRRSNISDRRIWCDRLLLPRDSYDCLGPTQSTAA